MREVLRKMPPEFPAMAALPIKQLQARFRASSSTVVQWRRELGVQVRVGAPAGNQNSLHNRGPRKDVRSIDGPEQIRLCLSCTAKRCTGSCARLWESAITTV